MRYNLMSQPPADEERKLVGFYIGEVQYGIDIMMVSEILNPQELIQIPTAPVFMEGVTDHRQAVVPIVDLRVRFGINGEAPNLKRKKWILVKIRGKNIGLAVDRATKVLSVSDSQRKDQHPLMASEDKMWIRDVFDVEKELIFELEPEAVVGSVVDFIASIPAESDYFDV